MPRTFASLCAACLPVVLSVCALSLAPQAVQAQEIVPPQGWKQLERDGTRGFAPRDLEAGQVLMVLVLPAERGAGDVKTWMEAKMTALHRGKDAAMSRTVEKGNACFATGQVDGQKRGYVARQTAGGKQMLMVLASDDQLFARGTQTLAAMLGGAGARSASATNAAGRGAAAGAGRPPTQSVTLPAASRGSLPPASLNGAQVFIKYFFGGYPVQMRFEHLVLFPDGAAFDDIPSDPMPRFDRATFRQMLKPYDIGTWKKVGNTIVLSFPNQEREPKRTLRRHRHGWYDGDNLAKHDTPYDIYYPVISPGPKAMLGAWKSSSLNSVGMMGGGAPMVAAGSNSDRVFLANGTYTDNRKSFVSATNQNMGDAYKGDGSFYVGKTGANRAAGRWRVDGPLLSLEKEGKRSVQLCFILPHWSKDKAAKPDLLIDGDLWERPKPKK